MIFFFFWSFILFVDFGLYLKFTCGSAVASEIEGKGMNFSCKNADLLILISAGDVLNYAFEYSASCVWCIFFILWWKRFNFMMNFYWKIELCFEIKKIQLLMHDVYFSVYAEKGLSFFLLGTFNFVMNIYWKTVFRIVCEV